MSDKILTKLYLSLFLLQGNLISYEMKHIVAPVSQPKEYKGQFDQDKYVDEHIFKGKRNGTFLDIGAYDGVLCSNTYYFEKYLGWTGICVEPMDMLYKALISSRSAICINGCISDKNGTEKYIKIINPDGTANGLSGLLDKYEPEHLERLNKEWIIPNKCKIEIIDRPCFVLTDILQKHNMLKIDFMSLDVEGAELDILKTIDFDKIFIDVITVENNYNKPEIRQLLESKGYFFITRLGVDELYRKKQI